MNVGSVSQPRVSAGIPVCASPEPLDIVLRDATFEDAAAIHALILEHLAEGHLLPRQRDEIGLHAQRFLVAAHGDRLVACAELAPLSRTVGEVRSLVVSPEVRGAGLGTRILDRLVQRAAAGGYDRLCAFTHAPSYFVQMGFSIVPHVWVPEKIVTDCHSCPHFRHCGQYPVVLELRRLRSEYVPLASLHA
jgi:amino-acid N-acetyltransferase